jgi:hypothetical protein
MTYALRRLSGASAGLGRARTRGRSGGPRLTHRVREREHLSMVLGCQGLHDHLPVGLSSGRFGDDDRIWRRRFRGLASDRSAASRQRKKLARPGRQDRLHARSLRRRLRPSNAKASGPTGIVDQFPIRPRQTRVVVTRRCHPGASTESGWVPSGPGPMEKWLTATTTLFSAVRSAGGGREIEQRTRRPVRYLGVWGSVSNVASG